MSLLQARGRPCRKHGKRSARLARVLSCTCRSTNFPRFGVNDDLQKAIGLVRGYLVAGFSGMRGGAPHERGRVYHTAARGASATKAARPEGRPVDTIDAIDTIDQVGLFPRAPSGSPGVPDFVDCVAASIASKRPSCGFGRRDGGHPRRTAGRHHDRIDRGSRHDRRRNQGPSRGAARYDECRPRRGRAAAFSRARVAEKTAFC